MKYIAVMLLVAGCGGSDFDSIESELKYKEKMNICEHALLEANKTVKFECIKFPGCDFCECWKHGIMEDHRSVHEIFNSWDDESCKEDHEAALFCKDNRNVCDSWFNLMVSVKCGEVDF